MYNPHPKNVISIKCSNYFRVQIGKEQIIETTMDSNSLLKRQNLFFFSPFKSTAVWLVSTFALHFLQGDEKACPDSYQDRTGTRSRLKFRLFTLSHHKNLTRSTRVKEKSRKKRTKYSSYLGKRKDDRTKETCIF